MGLPYNDTAVFIPLDESNLKRYLQDLLIMEEKINEVFGSVYSVERWGTKQFLSELDGKFEKSLGMVAGGQIIAFAVCSLPFLSVQHIHRIAVDPAVLRSGYGKKLLGRILEQWWDSPRLGLITAIVNSRNDRSLSLFRSAGFGFMTGTRLEAYLRSRGSSAALVSDTVFQDTGGVEYCMLFLEKKAETISGGGSES